MSIVPRTEDGKIDYKSMWEFKLLKWLGKAFLYIIFIAYLMAALPSVWNWAKLKYYGDDFSMRSLDQAVSKLIENNQTMTLLELLNAYPPTDSKKIKNVLEPYTPKLDARTFLSLSNKHYLNGDTEQAIFWYIYGRFRLRYDAVRCDYIVSEEVADDYAVLWTNFDLFSKTLNFTPEDYKPHIQKALDWDEKYPPENSPRYFCDFIEKYHNVNSVEILTDEDWEDRRKIMRFLSNEFINGNGAYDVDEEDILTVDEGEDIESSED